MKHQSLFFVIVIIEFDLYEDSNLPYSQSYKVLILKRMFTTPMVGQFFLFFALVLLLSIPYTRRWQHTARERQFFNLKLAFLMNSGPRGTVARTRI